MTTAMQLLEIKVRIDKDGTFVMTCDDIPGLLLASNNFLALKRDLPKAIKILYRDNFNMDVEAHEVRQVTLNTIGELEPVTSPVNVGLLIHQENQKHGDAHIH